MQSNYSFHPIAGFDRNVAVGLICYFCDRSSSLAKRKLTKLKLIKLIYLTEREFIERNGFPILLDEYFSLKDGPICSATLNIINDAQNPSSGLPFELIGDAIQLRHGVLLEEWLDALSEADIDAAERVWEKHGLKTASELRNYTHKYCPEYTHVTSGRSPIHLESLLSATGVRDAKGVASDIESLRRISSQF
ncbi:MAG: Panacea domain-containing protein [Geminicoccaceae bacterium]